MPRINCAIYTRKSTEHGLDMEFNSLQNQGEQELKDFIFSTLKEGSVFLSVSKSRNRLFGFQ